MNGMAPSRHTVKEPNIETIKKHPDGVGSKNRLIKTITYNVFVMFSVLLILLFSNLALT